MSEFIKMIPREYAKHRGISVQRVNKVLKEHSDLVEAGKIEEANKIFKYFGKEVEDIIFTGRGRERVLIVKIK